MGAGVKDTTIATGMGSRRQIFRATRAGAIASVAAGSEIYFEGAVLAPGKIVDAYVIPKTANGAATTLDVVISRISQALAAPLASGDALIPIGSSATGLQIPASGVNGVKVHATLAPESESGDTGKADAGAAGSIDLDTTTANTALPGYYTGGSVEILAGTGSGQVRQITAYDHNTNQRCTPATNFSPAVDGTSIYRVTRDNLNVRAGDQFVFSQTLTGANPGANVEYFVVVEFDERVS